MSDVCWAGPPSGQFHGGGAQATLTSVRGLEEMLLSAALKGKALIFALLAEKRMGPKLYGVFTGGRVEEYVKVIMWPLYFKQEFVR